MSESLLANPRWEPVLGAARHVLGVVVGGVLGTLLWLIVMQESVGKGYTDHNFNRAMGELFVDPEGKVARAGFRATVVIGIVLAAAYAAGLHRLLRGTEWRKALIFAAVPLLLWGLVFAPLTDA